MQLRRKVNGPITVGESWAIVGTTPGRTWHTIGRYTKDDRWTTEAEARHFAADEEKLLKHLGWKDLMVIAISYEESPPFTAERVDLPDELQWAGGFTPSCEGVLIGDVGGRRVVAVRRFVGFVAPHMGGVHLSGITAYWTSVIETSANSGRPMAFRSERYYADSYTPGDERTQRNKCIEAARVSLLYELDRDRHTHAWAHPLVREISDLHPTAFEGVPSILSKALGCSISGLDDLVDYLLATEGSTSREQLLTELINEVRCHSQSSKK